MYDTAQAIGAAAHALGLVGDAEPTAFTDEEIRAQPMVSGRRTHLRKVELTTRPEARGHRHAVSCSCGPVAVGRMGTGDDDGGFLRERAA